MDSKITRDLLLQDKSASLVETAVLSPAREFCQSAVHAAIDSPYKGVSQLIQHTSGIALPEIHLVQPPQPAKFNSADWHAQQFGGAIGMIVPFCLASGGVRGAHKLAGRMLKQEAAVLSSGAVANNLSKKWGTAIAESAGAGFVFDFTMKPVKEEDGNFWSARLRNGSCGALTFATLTASTLGLQELSKQRLAATPWLVHSTGRDLGRHVTAGLVAGVVDAQSRSLLAGKGLAGLEETYQSAYSFAVVGGGLRLKQEAFSKVKEQKSLSNIVSNEKSLQEQVLDNPDAVKFLLDHGNMPVGKYQAHYAAEILAGDFHNFNRMPKPSVRSSLTDSYYKAKWKLQDASTESKRLTYVVLNTLNLRHPLQRIGDAIYGTEIPNETAQPTLTQQNNPVSVFLTEGAKFVNDLQTQERLKEQAPDYKVHNEILDRQAAIRTDFALKLLQLWNGTAEQPGISTHTDAQLATASVAPQQVARIRAALTMKANNGDMAQALANLLPGGKELSLNVHDLHGAISSAKEKFYGYDERELATRMSMPGILHWKDHDSSTPLDWSPFEANPQLTHMFHGSISNSLPSILVERGMLPAVELRLRGIEQSTGECANEVYPRRSISLTRDFNEAWAYHRHSPASLTGFPIIFGVAKEATGRARLAGFSEPGEIVVDRLTMGHSLLPKVIGRQPDITHLYVPDSQIPTVTNQLMARRISGVKVVGLNELKTPQWKKIEVGSDN